MKQFDKLLADNAALQARCDKLEAALQEIADADASHLQFRWENIRGIARRALLQAAPPSSAERSDAQEATDEV